MFKVTLLFLTLSGLQAVPIAAPRDLRMAALDFQLPGLSETNRGGVGAYSRQGFGEMDRRHLLTDEVPDDIPVQKTGGSWMRVEELSSSEPADGFRQGTEPFMKIPDDFRQGTEPFMKIPDDFRQGTEPFMKMPDDFRQGTEPFMKIPDGFRQGTEPFMKIADGFRQGTEPFMKIPDDFRQGTEPFMRIADGFRQGTEPFMKIPDGFRQGTEPPMPCKGVVISGYCYEFIPTPLAFQEAKAFCRKLFPNAELASVPSSDLHSRLISLVTKNGKNAPMLTWIGGTIKVPGHPNIQSDKPVCIEMSKTDEGWSTVADCELQRASICSYPVTE